MPEYESSLTVNVSICCERAYGAELYSLVSIDEMDILDLEHVTVNDIDSSMAPDECIFRSRDKVTSAIPSLFDVCIIEQCAYSDVTLRIV